MASSDMTVNVKLELDTTRFKLTMERLSNTILRRRLKETEEALAAVVETAEAYTAQETEKLKQRLTEVAYEKEKLREELARSANLKQRLTEVAYEKQLLREELARSIKEQDAWKRAATESERAAMDAERDLAEEQRAGKLRKTYVANLQEQLLEFQVHHQDMQERLRRAEKDERDLRTIIDMHEHRWAAWRPEHVCKPCRGWSL